MHIVYVYHECLDPCPPLCSTPSSTLPSWFAQQHPTPCARTGHCALSPMLPVRLPSSGHPQMCHQSGCKTCETNIVAELIAPMCDT